MSESGEEPVFKITIQRESPVKGGEPKFTLVSENFTLPVGRSSSLNSPVFAVGTYVKCAVPRCNNYFDGQRSEFMGISYFPFPQDPDLRKEWIEAIDLPADKDPDQLKVCSDHFMNKDFIEGMIEVEDSQEQVRKSQENVELKPDAKPTVKLGPQARGNMAPNKMDTWEKIVKTYTKKGGEKSGFVGFDNPLMDTSNEIRCAVSSAASSNVTTALSTITIGTSQQPYLSSTSSSTPAMPVINSVGTIRPINIDYTGKPASTLTSPVESLCEEQNEQEQETADTGEGMLEVVEIEDDDDDLEMPPSWQKSFKEVERNPVATDLIKTEEGLINVPATVKLPPRRTITGDCNASTSSEVPVEGASTSFQDKTDPPGTSPMNYVAPPAKRRRRANREEMQRREEEDEWEPTIWRRRTLEKEGIDTRRCGQKSKNAPQPSKRTDEDSEDDALNDSDEGFKIDEPLATRSTNDKEKRRRPGPASKTCRPQYVPPVDQEKQQNPEQEFPKDDKLSETPPNNGVIEKDLGEVLADKSLLMDWSFFKSLIPDLGKMNRKKRDELKTFVLDTLNAKLYEGKPLIPNFDATAIL